VNKSLSFVPSTKYEVLGTKCANAQTTFEIPGHHFLRSERIMKKFRAKFRNVGSFIAGILVGLSLGIMVFAMTDAFPDGWQTLPVFGASIIVALGIALQIVATYRPRPRRRTDPAHGALPTPLVALTHER